MIHRSTLIKFIVKIVRFCGYSPLIIVVLSIGVSKRLWAQYEYNSAERNNESFSTLDRIDNSPQTGLSAADIKQHHQETQNESSGSSESQQGPSQKSQSPIDPVRSALADYSRVLTRHDAKGTEKASQNLLNSVSKFDDGLRPAFGQFVKSLEGARNSPQGYAQAVESAVTNLNSAMSHTGIEASFSLMKNGSEDSLVMGLSTTDDRKSSLQASAPTQGMVNNVLITKNPVEGKSNDVVSGNMTANDKSANVSNPVNSAGTTNTSWMGQIAVVVFGEKGLPLIQSAGAWVVDKFTPAATTPKPSDISKVRAAESFAQGPMADFSMAAYNRTDLPSDFVAQAKSFDSKLAPVAEQLVVMNANPAANAAQVPQVASDINNVLHPQGLHVSVEAISPTPAAPDGRLSVTTSKITQELTVKVEGQSIKVFETKAADGLNAELADHGHIPEGANYGIISQVQNTEKSTEIESFLSGQNSFALTEKGDQGLKPISAIPTDKLSILPVLDSHIRQDSKNISGPELKQAFSQLVAHHEAFHVYFKPAEKNIPSEKNAVQEQGAYLHELTSADPRLVKVSLTDILSGAINGSGSTRVGTSQALFSLQKALPQVKFVDLSSGRLNYDALPQLYSLPATTIQSAAKQGRDDLLNRYMPSPR